MIFDRHPEYRDKYGRHFWAGGYYVETVSQINEEMIEKNIEEQEMSRQQRKNFIGLYEDLFDKTITVVNKKLVIFDRSP